MNTQQKALGFIMTVYRRRLNNAIKVIEAPDFLLGPSSRLRMGKDT